MRSISKALPKLAMLLFFLNTATAYGACCLLPGDASVEAQLPCHQVLDDSADAEPADDCCLMCISVLQPSVVIEPSVQLNATQTAATTTLPATTGVDPPFRPPIHTLS